MQHTFMKRPFIRITFVIIALAAAAAVVIGDLARHAAGRKLREGILAELQPVALKNCTLKRFGNANDGGYLMRDTSHPQSPFLPTPYQYAASSDSIRFS